MKSLSNMCLSVRACVWVCSALCICTAIMLLLHYNKIFAFPDSKVHRANMGPTWVLSAPDGPHVGPMNLAIRVLIIMAISTSVLFFNGFMMNNFPEYNKRLPRWQKDWSSITYIYIYDRLSNRTPPRYIQLVDKNHDVIRYDYDHSKRLHSILKSQPMACPSVRDMRCLM